MSAISMIPITGWASTAGKYAKRALEAGDTVETVAKNADEVVGAGQALLKSADEPADTGASASKQLEDQIEQDWYHPQEPDILGGTPKTNAGSAGESFTAKPFELIPTQSKTLSSKEFSTLVDEIKANGISEPIKYVKYKGEMYIVDGHHRLLAAKKLG